jgi:hypothetical protein
MNSVQVDVHVSVRAIMSVTKRDPLEVAFKYPLPSPVIEVPPNKIDPDYVSVQLLFEDKNNRDFVLNMLLSSEFAKKLNLMVGDKLTLKLTKDS